MASHKKQTILAWYKIFLITTKLCSEEHSSTKRIGHFLVPPGLCFKTRVGAQPLIRKSFFILMQIKLIFTRKVGHLA